MNTKNTPIPSSPVPAEASDHVAGRCAVVSVSVVPLARKLARAIFESGSTEKHSITRIQFMSGKWPDEEKARGGLCERALQNIITQALREAVHPQNDAIRHGEDGIRQSRET